VTGYGEVDILHGVSLRVEREEMVAGHRPNGVGSTLPKRFGLLRALRMFLKGEVTTSGLTRWSSGTFPRAPGGQRLSA
jgi:ABC-type branched-subunit amino acid transport system ATPase component